MTKTTAHWSSALLDPPPGCTSAPEATILIQATSSPRHAPTMPACLTGHAPFCCSRGKEGGMSGGRWVGDGHPDYASSYGLFTLDTKQYGKQSIAPQRLKPHSPTTPASPFPSTISFRGGVASRVPVVAHVTRWFGPIGTHGLSWAEQKEEGKKNIFPLRFLILQRSKWSSSTVSCSP